MELMRNPAKIAIFGALTLLLAWSIDNLVRGALDRTVAAISSAKRALDDQERDAWLAGRLLDLQGSIASIQRMLMVVESRRNPVFSPHVLQLIERLAEYERIFQDLSNLAKRAAAANSTFSASVSGTATTVELGRLSVSMNELKNNGDAIQERLHRHVRAMKLDALAGRPYSPADDRKAAEELKIYETSMAEVLMKAKQVQQDLEVSIAAALAELQERRHWLELSSTTMRWLYVVLFLVGTGLTIAAKGVERKT